MQTKFPQALEINGLPLTYGKLIPVESITYFVEHSSPIIELPPPKIGPVEEAIGKHCASLVKNGDTLQLGIGAIPDAVLNFLKDKKNLGIHSEMFSDGVVALAEAGVITNQAKTLHPGKYVANFLMGTKRLYDFVDHNPDVLILPVNYVNNPIVIGQNDNLVSINSCVQVDLTGQVASESIGSKQISGIGGQVDFIRGAAFSKGGRSIIAMPSTAQKHFRDKGYQCITASTQAYSYLYGFEYIPFDVKKEKIVPYLEGIYQPDIILIWLYESEELVIADEKDWYCIVLGDGNFMEEKNIRKISTDYTKKMFDVLCEDIISYFS